MCPAARIRRSGENRRPLHQTAPLRAEDQPIISRLFRRKISEARPWGSRRERLRRALGEAGVATGHVQVDGVRLRYGLRPGVGEPLLLCNGIGANLEIALPFVRALPRRPVVLFDVPGTGGSAAAGFYPSFRRYARFAVGVLDQLGLGHRFAVAGVSWGGGLAQQIARDYPDRVRHLVLMATTPGVLMVPGHLSALLRMATPQRYLSRTFMARNAAHIYGGEMRGRPDLAIEFASMTRAPDALTYMQQLLTMLQFTSLPWLHRISCPAMVMTGSDDPLIRTVNGRLIAMLIRDSRLKIVEGGGHLFMVLRPEATAAEVEQFLAGS